MFAFFGLGAQELILLALPILAVVVIVALFLVVRTSSSHNRINALEQENRQLREDLDRSKDRQT